MERESDDTRGKISSETAFSALSNATRLDMLRVLHAADEPLAYSELLDRIDYESAPNLPYHLDRVVGQFVRRRETGYELTWAGKNIVRAALIAGTVSGNPTVEPVVVDLECPICASPIEVAYRDHGLMARCTRCVGLGPAVGSGDGSLILFPVPPAGLVDRSPEAVLRATVTSLVHYLVGCESGVCPECAGIVEEAVDVCEDHVYSTTDGCTACGRYHLSFSAYTCAQCSSTLRSPTSVALLTNPQVLAFYHDHGVVTQLGEWEAFRRVYAVEETLIESDPVRLRLTFPCAEDRLLLTVDDTLGVHRVERE